MVLLVHQLNFQGIEKAQDAFFPVAVQGMGRSGAHLETLAVRGETRVDDSYRLIERKLHDKGLGADLIMWRRKNGSAAASLVKKPGESLPP